MIIQIQPNIFEQIFIVLRLWDRFLSGFILTLWLYMWALLIGFFLGLFLALLRQYGGFILSRISTGYIEIIRGTPLLAQLFFLYYIPLAFNITIGTWSFESSLGFFEPPIIFLNFRTLIAIITLGLNSAAYQAEYLRGAIISVRNEQLIAAQSLGMSRTRGIIHVVLPQALRRVIPAWSNEAAYLPKYTVVVYFIGVTEIFAQAFAIAFDTYAIFFTYVFVAIFFLITISIISKGLDVLHKRTSIPGL